MSFPKHLPETKILSEILPKGREGGLEFARIVDLLLFHEARRQGRNLTLFSDRAGDYRGLDSFGDDVLRQDNRIGYQYKFFPSPLSAAHRQAINEALTKVVEANKKLKPSQRVTKWILVTPDDLTESGRRNDGGDVSWFDGLTERLKLGFEVEHWGHRKLQALFLETPFLCLFYYPELVQKGALRRRTIEETRLSYDTNLHDLYGRIEFVGMSVYKPEATRGVPMEHIYIPLSTVLEQADDRDPSTLRVNPMKLLLPAGRCHVILGDPGSGKSTLLKFLALAGDSKALQERYGFPSDRRLPILVVLRRYADALKCEPDLGLLDYIQRSLRADLSLPHADHDFFEYYLESGEALLLFDGMDELPNPQFKKIVRDRIHCLLNTYPGNTAIITSRIVGYENPHRFDDRTYHHSKVARLALPEMERFITDWYAARIENDAERRANVADLTRILHDSQHQAIGDLASNPLLLTIIALVHRIDAVLPDERVVLYQKCTETLLNTWHTWKFRADEVQERRGKIERRNRRRIESLAYWMHQQAGSGKAKERAVVTYEAARDLLVTHIRTHEPGDSDDAQDEAENFLEFVKSRAGLLIEVGDCQYSFVHLTFQEYLAATDLTARMEMGGVEALWEEINSVTSDSRWHEVLRLLIAGLRFGDSQAFLVKRLLDQAKEQYEPHLILLLGGLLLDGIEAAEQEGLTICELLFTGCIKEQENELATQLVSVIKGLGNRPQAERPYLDDGFQSLWRRAIQNEQVAMSLVWLAAGFSEFKLAEITNNTLTSTTFEWIRFLLIQSPTGKWSSNVIRKQKILTADLAVLATIEPWTNGIAAMAESALTVESSFILRLFMILECGGGPFEHFGRASSFVTPACDLFKKGQKVKERFAPRSKSALGLALSSLISDRRTNRHRKGKARNQNKHQTLHRKKHLMQLRRGRQGAPGGIHLEAMPLHEKQNIRWNRILSDKSFTVDISIVLIEALDLKPTILWQEALRTCFVPRIPQRLGLYYPETWQRLEMAFDTECFDLDYIYAAAWIMLYDLWLFLLGVYDKPMNSPFSHLADLTRSSDSPPLRVAHILRDLAHGDKTRMDELISLVKSSDPAYKTLFKAAMWID